MRSVFLFIFKVSFGKFYWLLGLEHYQKAAKITDHSVGGFTNCSVIFGNTEDFTERSAVEIPVKFYRIRCFILSVKSLFQPKLLILVLDSDYNPYLTAAALAADSINSVVVSAATFGPAGAAALPLVNAALVQ